VAFLTRAEEQPDEREEAVEQVVYVVLGAKLHLASLAVAYVEGVARLGECERFRLQELSECGLSCCLVQQRVRACLLVLARFERFQSFPGVPEFLEGLAANNWIGVEEFSLCDCE
jgi:hypothetical protein